MRLFGKQASGVGMQGMSFRDYWVPGCNGCREITTGDAAEGQGEIVGTKNGNRSDARQIGPNVCRVINGWVAPACVANGSRCGS